MQHTLWYLPVAIVLTLGYAIGGIAPVAIHYFGWLECILPTSFIPVLLSFLLGFLGANVQLSILFSREINTLMSTKDKSAKEALILPSCFEFFGYLLKQIWGGLAAVFFVLSVKLGFLAAVATSGAINLPAIVVISFCAGLRAYSILVALAGLIPKKA